MYSQNIYVIRKGDMVIRPAFDDDDQRNGSEIIRFDKTRIKILLKSRKSLNALANFMVILILARKQRQTALLAFLVNHLFY